MSIRFPLLRALAAATPFLPARAQLPTPTLTLPRDSAVIPLDKSAVRPTFTVTIRGKPYRFILDTGAGGSFIDADLAKQLGLEVIGRSRVAAPGGPATEVDIVSAGTIAIGDATLTNAALRSFPLRSQNISTDGVLSSRAFAGSVISLDLQRSTLTLARGSLSKDAPGTLAYEVNQGLIQLPATIAGRVLSLDLDTGNPSNITLPRSLMDSLPLKRAAVPGPDARLVSGPRKTWTAQLHGTVQIAGRTVTDPDVTFIDLDRANVGTAFVRQFVVSIDQAQQRIRLVRTSRAREDAATVDTNVGPSPECSAPGPAVDGALQRVVAAVNVGTFAAVDDAIGALWSTDRLTSDRRAALRTMLGRWHWQSTTLTPVRRCGSNVRGYALLDNAQTGEVDSLQILMVPGSAMVGGLMLFQGAHVPVSPADTANDDARAAALRALARRMAAAGVFSGEVLFAHSGRILYHEALGTSNRTTGRRARLGDVYSIASTGKLITATAIMQLVEQRRISLDDTLGKFLAKGERPAAAGSVPIKTILSHTDGMTNGSDSLAFPPGTRFSYVNYGYFLLGRVIEKVTGKPFANHFADAVFAPARMTSTLRLEVTTPDPALPVAYDIAFDSAGIEFIPNPQAQTIAATGAGGLFSNTLDLFRLAEALRSGRLVSKSTLRAMRTPRRELGALDYGYGVDLFRGNAIWGHSGAIPGAESELELYGDSGYVFVLLGNTVTGDPIRRLVNVLVGTRRFCDKECPA